MSNYLDREIAVIEAILKPRAEAFILSPEEIELLIDQAPQIGIEIFNRVIKYFDGNDIIVSELVVSKLMVHALFSYRYSDMASKILQYQKRLKIVPSQTSLGRIFNEALRAQSFEISHDILSYAENNLVILSSQDLTYALIECIRDKNLMTLVDYITRNKIIIDTKDISLLLEQAAINLNQDAFNAILIVSRVTEIPPNDFNKFISNLMTVVAKHGIDAIKIVIIPVQYRGIKLTMDILFPAIDAAARYNEQFVIQTLLDLAQDRRLTSEEIVQILLRTISLRGIEIAKNIIPYGPELNASQIGHVVQSAAASGWHQLISHLITYLDGRGLTLSSRVIDISVAVAEQNGGDDIVTNLRQYAISHHIQL